MTKKRNSVLFSSLLYILVGVLLVIFRSQTLDWAMTIAGVFFVISGVLDLIKKNWMSGGISIVIGVAILVLGWLATKIVLVVLGVLIALKGVLALISLIKSKKWNLAELIYAILSVVVGLMLAFGNGLNVMIVIVGVLLIIDGIIGLLGALKKK